MEWKEDTDICSSFDKVTNKVEKFLSARSKFAAIYLISLKASSETVSPSPPECVYPHSSKSAQIPPQAELTIRAFKNFIKMLCSQVIILPREDGVTSLMRCGEVAHHCARPVLARLKIINNENIIEHDKCY